MRDTLLRTQEFRYSIYSCTDKIKCILPIVNMDIHLAQNVNIASNTSHEDVEVGIRDDQLAFRIVSVIAGLVTISGNGMLILCILLNSKLQTNTNCFILNLAFSDLLIGVVLPVVQFTKWEIGKAGELACLASSPCPILASVLASMFFQVAIAFERLLFIMWPLRYRQIATKRNIIYSSVAIWCYALLNAYIPVLGWNNIARRQGAWTPHTCKMILVLRASYIAYIIIHGLVTIVLVALMYGILFYTARSQARKIDTQCAPNPSQLNPTGKVKLKPRRKGVLILAIMVTYFLISLIPQMLYLALEYDWFREETVYQAKLPGYVKIITINLLAANSAITPYIYGFGYSRMRRGLVALLKCRRMETRDLPTTDSISTR